MGVCAALALLMHGAVFASFWHSSQFDHAKSGAKQLHGQSAMRVTLMKLSPGTELKSDPVALTVPAPIKPRQALAGAASIVRTANHEMQALAPPAFDGPLLIDYPDAPLPGGWLRMRVFIQFDAAGRVQTLQSDADAESGAPFVDAVRRGLAAAAFAPAPMQRGASATNQCLELVFDEQHPEVKVRFLEGSARERAACLGATSDRTAVEQLAASLSL